MRKVSKSRTDDEVISSTNGSVAADQPDTEQQTDPKEKDEHSDANESVSQNNEQVSDTSKQSLKKGKAAKSKVKKRKLEKEKDVSDEEEYEVEKVIDSKKIKGKLHYLIRWKGYSADSDTWEPSNTLSCPELIAKFNEEKESPKVKESKSKTKVKKLKSGKVSKSPAKRPKTSWDSKDGEENAEYEVERILEVHHKKNGSREFLIHWKGWSNKFDSWEPESNLSCPELINKFMEKVTAARSGQARSLRVAPAPTTHFTLHDPSCGRRLSKRRPQRQRVRYDDAE